MEAVAQEHVLAGIDDDIANDLRAIGVELVPDVEKNMDDSHRQAMAAMLFRRVRGIERAITTLREARNIELTGIAECYERQMAPLVAQSARLLGFVEVLAEHTPWGKKKSAETPYGTYGVTNKGATVALVDSPRATEWAKANEPQLVRVVATLPLSDAMERFSTEELSQLAKIELQWGELKKTLSPDGELPPGVQKVDAKIVPYAKVS